MRATLAGGATACDVLVLRRRVDGVEPPAQEAPTGMEEEARSGAAGAASVEAARAWVRAGWRDGGGTWSKRFLGSMGRDGVVALEEQEES